MTVGAVEISDHALLRFIERIYGLDLEPVRQELVRRCEKAAAAGAARLIIDDTVFCFGPGPEGKVVVVTIVDREMYAERRQQPLRTQKKRSPRDFREVPG